MRIILLLFVIINTFITNPVVAAKDSSFVTISFSNRVGGELLQLGKTYNNPFNESFAVNRFKYYVSNFAFQKIDGSSMNVPGYFLVNEEDSISKSFELPLKDGSYEAVTFLIGVDSIKNVSGTQADALDPMNGMFWTWNSGYIMAKLEATSPLSKAPNNLVEFHIGGFRVNQNTVRSVTLPFPSNDFIKMNNKAEIVIEADINKWFNGKHDLKIAEHTACTTPGTLAVQYADNYAHLFKIVSINYTNQNK